MATDTDKPAPAAGQSRIELDVYEVFAQASHDSPHQHLASLLAPSPDMALILARENLLRRDRCVSLWVVRRQDIHATSYEDTDFFARELDRRWREAGGYPENARRWQKYRRQAMSLDDLVKD